MTWALTPWGLICKDIADEFVSAYPQFTIGIGPDPDDLADMGHRVTFVVLDGSIVDPRYAGSDETHPTFDEVLPIQIRIHVPSTIDPTTQYDTSPVLAESAKSTILEAIDSERHVGYFEPKTIPRRGGRIGEAGTTITILGNCRIENFRTPATMTTASSTTIGLSTQGDDIEVINAP